MSTKDLSYEAVAALAHEAGRPDVEESLPELEQALTSAMGRAVPLFQNEDVMCLTFIITGGTFFFFSRWFWPRWEGDDHHWLKAQVRLYALRRVVRCLLERRSTNLSDVEFFDAVKIAAVEVYLANDVAAV